jgi:uncharacterized protein
VLVAIAAAALALLPLQPPSLADEVVMGRVETVRSLIAGGADVNEADETGVTPLMRAASAGRGDIVTALLAGGARVDAKTNGGVTALMMACLGGYLNAIAPLLAHHADPKLHDNQGRTALMAAASNGDVAVVDAVLAAGGELAAVDAGNSSALTYAAAEGHADAVATLERRGAKPGDAELALAAGACNTSIVRTFLAAGMSADGREPANGTALHAAAGANCVETAALLIERGANVNAKDHDGWTPLIKASEAGHLDMVRLLLQKGADVRAADAAGRTAWMYAAMGNHVEIAELFKQARGAATPPPAPIRVGSATLQADRPMPRDYTADGRNVSPPLAWSDLPPDVKSIAVVCEDPDAGNPPPFVHWVVYNIPPSAKGLPENVPFEPGAAMPREIGGAVQGMSGFRRPIYRGPAPPSGKPHHYHFVVYALDVADLKPGLTRAELLDAANGHVLATGELVVTYERTP